MIRRIIKPLMSNSFLLFGPRGTGKSTFLRDCFADVRKVLWLDLLDPEQEDRYSRRPNELSDQIAHQADLQWVVIDEIQRVPRLLDVVHGQMERGPVKFAMTGSSARRLKRGATNLLAGRAFVYHLFPFTHTEMGDAFGIEQVLQFGSLPRAFTFTTDEERRSYLRAYSLTYLREEVWAEHLVRNLDPFRRFLEIAAQTNGEIVNYSNVARDVGVDTKTVQAYFQIMEDTLMGFMLEPFRKSVRKRQTEAPKFYLFDPGVKRSLDRTLTVPLIANTYAYGRAFEHFIIVEAMRLSEYRQNEYRFSYLRTKDGAEIDLIMERPGQPTALVEIKSATQVDERDTRGLERLAADIPGSEPFCLSQDPASKRIGTVTALHWTEGFRHLGLA